MTTLPQIEHAKVDFNELGFIEIKMEEGWYFYRKDHFPDEEFTLEEIPKSIGGAFTPDTDFSVFVVKEFEQEVTDNG